MNTGDEREFVTDSAPWGVFLIVMLLLLPVYLGCLIVFYQGVKAM